MKTTLKEWFATTAVVLSLFSVIFTAKGFQDLSSSEITSERNMPEVEPMPNPALPHFAEPAIFTPAMFEADANRANPRCVQGPRLYNALNTH